MKLLGWAALAWLVAETKPLISLSELLPVLTLLGGAAGVTTLLLAPRQGKNLAVTASETAVRAVNEAMETMRRELDMTRRDLQEAERELTRMQARLDIGTQERESLEAKVKMLQGRVADLEQQLGEQRRAIDHGDIPEPYEGRERRRNRRE